MEDNQTSGPLNENPEDVHSELPIQDINVKKRLFTDAMDWVKTILFAVVLALIVTRFIIVNASVPTGSMENTIRARDRIVANRLSYLFSGPDTFDIIIFAGPDNPDTLYVKRVIGTPGQSVQIINGQVFIDSAAVPLRDDFVFGERTGNFGPVVVPYGHYFVLGDYRSNSVDSRSWRNVFVYEGSILGRVIFRYFPGFRNLSGT